MNRSSRTKIICGAVFVLCGLVFVGKAPGDIDKYAALRFFYSEPFPSPICNGKNKLKLDFSKTFFHAKIKILGPGIRVRKWFWKMPVQVIEELRGVVPAETFSLHYPNVSSYGEEYGPHRYPEGEVFFIFGKIKDETIHAHGISMGVLVSSKRGLCVKGWFSEWLSKWFPAPHE